MKKKDLIIRLEKRFDPISARDATVIVETVFAELGWALARGHRIELRGFGSFYLRKLEHRKARNPKTRESIFVKAKSLPRFRTGKELHERLNGQAGHVQRRKPPDSAQGSV